MIKNTQKYKDERDKFLEALRESRDFQIVKESFPHIASKMEEFWGTSKMHEYMVELFEDTRGNHRKGFLKDVSDALFHLLNFHDKSFNFHAKPFTSTEMWESMRFK